MVTILYGVAAFAIVIVGLVLLLLAAKAKLAYALGRRLPDWNGPKGKRIWAHCFGMALFTNAIPFTLLSWGQTYVTSGFAGITMAGVPLLVLPLAAIFVPGEALTRRWYREAMVVLSRLPHIDRVAAQTNLSWHGRPKGIVLQLLF